MTALCRRMRWRVVLDCFLPPVQVSGNLAGERLRKDVPDAVVVFASSGEGQGAMGSGIALDRRGLVLTNAHVVTASGGRSYARFYV